MSTATRPRTKNTRYTFEEFCELIPEGVKADLIEGVIYMASPDNLEHHSIYLWLSVIISCYLEEKEILGRLFGSRIAFRINMENSPEPDIAYIRPKRMHLLRSGYVEGPPDLAIEIVSLESAIRDYEKKRQQYEAAGVQEYWIIDPLEQTMVCFARGRDGKFKKVKTKGGKIHSKVIPGFWVRPSWFWLIPLPNKKEILAEILESLES